MLMFGLGLAAGIVMVFIIAMVVVMFKLTKRVAKIQKSIKELEEDIRVVERDIISKVEDVVRVTEANFDQRDRSMETSILVCLEDAKKYTDSRLDKELAKLTK